MNYTDKLFVFDTTVQSAHINFVCMPGVFMYVHMLKNGILKKELKTKQNQKLQGQPEGGKK